MPSTIVKYKVFVGTPGGLDETRNSFRQTLEEYNRLETIPRGVLFEPIGRETTLAGVGRPQALINEDLRGCDHSVFVFRDRWGSPTGGPSGFSSGCEEE